MSSPIIGISSSIIISDGSPFPGIERVYVNKYYTESVIKAGGAPIVLPVTLDDESIKRQVEVIDGLILSGGYDINPLTYGEEPTQSQGFTFPEIDEYNLKLVKFACELKKPIFGICRGLQILNIAFGGSLYQDLSYIDGSYIKHYQLSKGDMTGHSINVVEHSLLYDILGENYLVNSFHHQSIKDLADGFKVTAKSKDGLIEAIEKLDDQFIIGVQWHPEMMTAKDFKMLEIFKLLVKQSKRGN